MDKPKLEHIEVETDRHFYVKREMMDRETLQRKIIDSAGELAFWSTIPVYLMEVTPESYMEAGKVMNRVSVTKVNGEAVTHRASADLDLVVAETIQELVKDKPAWIVTITSDYRHGDFAGVGRDLYYDQFRPDPAKGVCFLGTMIDVSKYEVKK